MIGFPKKLTDFSKNCPPPFQKKEWKSFFENQAQSYLQDQYFFSKKKENGKYFPLQKFINQDFHFNLKDFLPLKEKISPLLPNSLCLSIHNGEMLSPLKQTKDLMIFPLSDFFLSQTQLEKKIKENILSSLNKKRNPFCHLSNILFKNGFIIIIKKHLKQPLEIHYTHSGKEDHQGIHFRNFIFMEEQSSAQILEVFHGRLEEKTLFFNIQTDLFINKQAELEHIRLDQTKEQDVLINQLFADLSKQSQARFYSFSFKAAISRWLSELKQKEKSLSEIKGLSILGGNKYAEHNTSVLHEEEKGVSEQSFKSFLFDSAKQIFQGFLYIEKKAQHTLAEQVSNNFLFGKKAFAVASPTMDVIADNVKANHGATISPFTENQELIFYLQSRGIDSLSAIQLILMGMTKSILDGLQKNTKKVMQNILQKHLSDIKKLNKEINL